MVIFIPWEMRIKKIESKYGHSEEWGRDKVQVASPPPGLRREELWVPW